LNLFSWSLVVEGTGQFRDRPGYRLEGRLVCPVCKSTHDFKTDSIELSPWEVENLKSLNTIVAWASKQRTCSQCGVISMIPERQCEKLFTSLKETVTTKKLTEILSGMDVKRISVTRRGPSPADDEYADWGYQVADEHKAQEVILAKG
jgi:hypothetical protein